jgi:type 1 glutamine amidotransferase
LSKAGHEITSTEGKDFIRSGKGFVCLHISTCLPKAWPEYQEITAGEWIAGASVQPPDGAFTAHVRAPRTSSRAA